MAIYGYTKNYKLIKPQFNTDTWHDYIYDNLDTIDAIMSAIYSSGNWQGFWKKNTHYDVGDVVIDKDTDTMYKVLVEHTTSENTFALEQAAHPTYYELWSPNNLAESWAIDMDGLVSSVDYSSKAYAISSALIDAGSAKEWAIKTGGSVGTTGEYSAKKHANDAASSASTAASEASNAANSATLSQKWAVDANLVASTDYSSKSWATGSLDAGSAKDWAIKEGGSIGTTGKYSAKVYSLAAQNHYEKAKDWASKTNGQVESTDYSAKAYAISEGLISDGSAKEWSNKAKAWATSSSIVEDGKYGASYYALQAYNANVSAQNNKTLSKDWATKMDGQVESTDYSSKYYAGQSANSASYAAGVEANIHNIVDDAAQTLSEILNSPFFFGQSMYSENAPYNASWLASNGQYNAASVYPDFWTQLTGVELNTSLNVGDTIEISGKTYVKRGLPVVLSTGTITDYDFVVNQNDQTFRLPLLNGEEDLPSDRYDDLTIQASGSTYTVPANGTVVFGRLANIPASGYTAGLTENIISGMKGTYYSLVGSYGYGFSVLSILKGDVFRLIYSASTGAEPDTLRFYYAKGNGTLYYYVGDTVQDASLINAGAILGQLANKADIDASNFNADGKSLLSGLGMPSGRYTNLTLLASGSTYTAPANGWFNAITSTSASGINVGLMAINTTTGFYAGEQDDHAGYRVASFQLPVRKGDVMQFYYYGYTAMSYFRFYYAEGEN